MRLGATLQGDGKRRGNGGATRPKDDMDSLWEVVSALANALTDARDQLVTLMNNSKGDVMRMSGGCGRHSPGRTCSPYPGAGTWIRNVHRGHAHSHVAFGSSTEYRLHPTPVRARLPRAVHAEMSASHVRRAPGRGPCTHPLHKMSPARNPPQLPWQPQVVVNAGRASGCDGLSRRARGPCVTINTGPPCNNNANNRNSSPDPRRHCIGTQHAALLRHEAYQMRERRAADESCRNRRTPWSCR